MASQYFILDMRYTVMWIPFGRKGNVEQAMLSISLFWFCPKLQGKGNSSQALTSEKWEQSNISSWLEIPKHERVKEFSFYG